MLLYQMVVLDSLAFGRHIELDQVEQLDKLKNFRQRTLFTIAKQTPKKTSKLSKLFLTQGNFNHRTPYRGVLPQLLKDCADTKTNKNFLLKNTSLKS